MSGTILVADPDATSRITLKVRLAAACYTPLLAASVDDTVRAARTHAPDVILADESFLHGDAGLCSRLAADPATRGIAVIALCTAGGRLGALKAGADAVVDRPADEFMLLARIRSLRAGHQTAKAPAEAFCGMAEAQAAFAFYATPAPTIPTSPTNPARPAAASRPAQDGGRLVLVADPATVVGWRQVLSARTDLSIEATSAERALAQASSGQAGDVYLIAADLALPGDGLRLLSELRARPASRGAAFVIALHPDRGTLAPVALDLGADDVLPVAMRERAAADEAAVRVMAQFGRKRAADHRRAVAERERHLALIDPLTGLHNRRYALPRLAAMTQIDAGIGLAVIVLDLDRFKAINDSHGHAAGDTVLAEVAARLGCVLPPGALAARIGGEEFLVAIAGLTPGAAFAAAEALRQAIAGTPVRLPALLGGGAIAVTASLGLAHGRAGDSAEVLMLAADRALLDAKALGRDRVVTARQEAAA